MKLKEKVIIVTGASRGLGVAMAEACAAEGARVVCAARSEHELDRVVTRIRNNNGIAHRVVCNVASLNDLRRLTEECIAVFGGIHGLINNAGVNFMKSFIDITEEEWDRVLDVDLKGSFFLSQLCVKQMLRQKQGGSIVQIASVHTHASLVGAAPYDAAKHGMVGFSKAAAVELARDRIRFNILSPGLCRTEIWKDIIAAAPSEEKCLDYWNANIPAGRLIECEEIAKCCVFLLSEDSSAITGANIFADLGMTSLLVSREPYESRAITNP